MRYVCVWVWGICVHACVCVCEFSMYMCVCIVLNSVYVNTVCSMYQCYMEMLLIVVYFTDRICPYQYLHSACVSAFGFRFFSVSIAVFFKEDCWYCSTPPGNCRYLNIIVLSCE